MTAKEQSQLQAVTDYRLAQLIGAAFTDKFPKTLKDAYPDLFDSESGASGGWRENKRQWQKYAEEFNRQKGDSAV